MAVTPLHTQGLVHTHSASYLVGQELPEYPCLQVPMALAPINAISPGLMWVWWHAPWQQRRSGAGLDAWPGAQPLYTNGVGKGMQRSLDQ